MKTFFEWILSENEASLKHLIPQEQIGSGNFATVYATQDPNIVMRVERKSDPNSCEKFMEDPAIQATGGVAKIFGTNNQTTYKERVNINWSQYLATKYRKVLKKMYDIPKLLQIMPYGLETAKKHGEIAAFLQLAIEAFRQKDAIIEFLRNFKEAEGLIKAIEMGLPFDDLHTDNLGINGQGKLVVIDC
jgi:hypothetical protein